MDANEFSKLVLALKAMTGVSPVSWFVLCAIAAAVCLGALAKFLEVVVKIFGELWSFVVACVSLIRGGRSHREWISRRKQFLRVLASDLSSIAKAEAWNDQQFTDLEAEVEIEGKYYASALRRVLRKKSSGLRREPSLIRAIDQSSERCLLLTGDPGAGKSVALRHLAMQMIERSMRSSRTGALVPLYINLREMNINGGEDVTVDMIRGFVIDNVRRGDADTAEYLKSNWDEFQRKGVWFFLFDSFDEIPAVLHSAANDAAVAKFGRGIQQFMDGLGGCRGVLASREYKSPGSLSWPKLRILPLSEEKQEELVRRTFLTDDQKTIALRALTLSNSATYKNPLFLTLLCRYVRENCIAPANEHELLYAHVESLARRDNEFVQKRWGLKPSQLLDGALQLSRLFAVDQKLGLAPTLEEIMASAEQLGAGFDSTSVANLVEALTYVKIARTDVASADSSARRFAFSHRRYQECLFAVFLARNIDMFAPRDLLVNARWREYLVAMLQLADQAAISKLVMAAARLIDDKATSLKLSSRRYHGSEVRQFAWDDSELEHVLSVFVEAKRYAPDGPWLQLVGPCEKIFGQLWAKGDYYDRKKILSYCGIGNENALVRRLDYSVACGVKRLEESAIDTCGFVKLPSPGLASWVRRNVGFRIVLSLKRFEFLRWEAVAAQLPAQYHMAFCLERAKAVSSYSGLSKMFFNLFSGIADLTFRLSPLAFSGGVRTYRNVLRSSIGLKVGQTLYALILIFILAWGIGSSNTINMRAKILCLAFVLWFGWRMLLYLARLTCLDLPQKLTLYVVASHWNRAISRHKRHIIFAMAALVLFSLPGIIAWRICTRYWPGRFTIPDMVLGGSVCFWLVIFFAFYPFAWIKSRRAASSARDVVACSSSLWNAVSQARSGEELVAISGLARYRGATAEGIRVCIAYLSVIDKLAMTDGLKNPPRWLLHATQSDVRSSISKLIGALDSALRERRLRGV